MVDKGIVDYTDEELITRVGVFDDYEEIVDALNELVVDYSTSTMYYMKEAAVHISGLTELTKELANRLKKNAA